MINTNPLTPYMMKYSYPSFELNLSSANFKVLETVLLNNRIPQTPSTKEDYY